MKDNERKLLLELLKDDESKVKSTEIADQMDIDQNDEKKE